jgi:hypothetical protein
LQRAPSPASGLLLADDGDRRGGGQARPDAVAPEAPSGRGRPPDCWLGPERVATAAMAGVASAFAALPFRITRRRSGSPRVVIAKQWGPPDPGWRRPLKTRRAGVMRRQHTPPGRARRTCVVGGDSARSAIRTAIRRFRKTTDVIPSRTICTGVARWHSHRTRSRRSTRLPPVELSVCGGAPCLELLWIFGCRHRRGR